MRWPVSNICLAAILLADAAFSMPFLFNDPALIGQTPLSLAIGNNSTIDYPANFLALTNAAPGTPLTASVVANGVIPINAELEVYYSDNAINQFTVSTNGPAFHNPIQIGTSFYSGSEARTVMMTNDQPYSTIRFSMPQEGLPYLYVSGFVMLPPFGSVSSSYTTYDLIVIGTVTTNEPYITEDWTLQVTCGPTNYLDVEDANGISGTLKLSWAAFPANRWLYFAMTVNTTNNTETAQVFDASDWSLVTAVTNTMSVHNAFLNYWLFGNNEVGNEAGLNIGFSGLNWANSPPPTTTATINVQPANQLLAQYKFNGDFKDSGPGGYDAAGWGQTLAWVAGQSGTTNQALNLYLASVNSQVTNPASAMTVSFWTKTTTGGGMPVAQSEFTSWFTYLDFGGHIEFNLKTTSGVLDLFTSRTITDNQWHLVVCTWDGTAGDHAARIYVDGALDATSSGLSGTIIPPTADFRMGSGISGFYFTGTLDDVRLYGRALGAAEVQAVFTAGAN